MGVKLKFEIGNTVWCIRHGEVKHRYVSSIRIYLRYVEYFLEEFEEDIKKENSIGWAFREDEIFLTKKALIESL